MKENNRKIFITAEIGLNHNNNFNKTKKLINHAISAGADAVKFQLFKSNSLYPKGTKEYKYLKKYETKLSFFKKILSFCEKENIICYASAFDNFSINFLIKYKSKIYKWASSEVDKLKNLKKVASQKKLIIISTGMANREDIVKAIEICKKAGNKNIVLMHCVSQYPQKIYNANINKLDSLKKFGYKLGFSDHSRDSTSAILAIAKGATFLEKHITWNNKSKGPDHFYACEINKFKKYINDIRKAEKALGKPDLKYDRHVMFNTRRQSYYAKKEIKQGEKINYNLIYLKRSLEGLNKNSIEKYLKKKITVNIRKNQAITEKHFK